MSDTTPLNAETLGQLDSSLKVINESRAGNYVTAMQPGEKRLFENGIVSLSRFVSATRTITHIANDKKQAYTLTFGNHREPAFVLVPKALNPTLPKDAKVIRSLNLSSDRHSGVNLQKLLIASMPEELREFYLDLSTKTGREKFTPEKIKEIEAQIGGLLNENTFLEVTFGMNTKAIVARFGDLPIATRPVAAPAALPAPELKNG